MIYLSVAQIIALHKELIESSGGFDGIRSETLLDLSVNSIRQTFDGVDLYPGLIRKAVRLCFSLILNHAFIDGNKRIGLHAMVITLKLNGFSLKYVEDELINFVLEVASGNKTESELLQWVTEHLSRTDTD